MKKMECHAVKILLGILKCKNNNVAPIQKVIEEFYIFVEYSGNCYTVRISPTENLYIIKQTAEGKYKNEMQIAHWKSNNIFLQPSHEKSVVS